MTTNSYKIRKMTITAILAGVSAVLMFFSFNVPVMPPFIKMDFSDFPAVLASFALGPMSGVGVAFLKNLINLLFTTTAGVGELSNFILSATFALTAGNIYKHRRTMKNAIIAALIGSFTMGICGIVSNFFIIYPMYFSILGFKMEDILAMYSAINPFIGSHSSAELDLFYALTIFNFPFTFVKGFLSVVITFLIYKPLSPIIHGKHAH